MNRNNRKKSYLAGFLAALAVTGLTFGSVLSEGVASPQMAPQESCSLTLGVGTDSIYAEELENVSWDAGLYRIASLEEKGACVAEEGFEDIIEEINAAEDLTAARMETLAKEAAGVVGWQEEGDWETLMEPDARIHLKGGGGQAESLDTGIYLVLPEDAVTAEHIYRFQPSLITLPRQLDTGEWTSDVEASLKPEQEPRYGSLRIRKTLDSYNESLGAVTFVFQIEGVSEAGETVYSNVAATTHSGAGTVDAVVERIPAGTQVTVTEIYSGASYTLVSEASQEGVITADQELGMEFSNTYDDRLVPGYGAVNQFSYEEDAGWTWNRLDGADE